MKLKGCNGDVFCIASYKNTIVSAGHDKHIRVWNNKGELKGQKCAHDHVIRTLAIYAGPGTLCPCVISGSWDCTIKIFNLKSLKLLFTLHGKSRIRCLCAVSDHNVDDPPVLISGSDDGKVCSWNIRDGTHLHTFQDSTKISRIIALDVSILSMPTPPNSVSVPPSLNLMASCSENSISLWWLTTGKLIRTIDVDKEISCLMFFKMYSNNSRRSSTRGDEILNPQNQESYARIASSNRLLISGYIDGSISVHNADSAQLLYSILGHTCSLSNFCVSNNHDRNFPSDSQTLYSCSHDGFVKSWSLSLHEGQCCGNWYPNKSSVSEPFTIHCVRTVSTDDKSSDDYIVVGGALGFLILMPIETSFGTQFFANEVSSRLVPEDVSNKEAVSKNNHNPQIQIVSSSVERSTKKEKISRLRNSIELDCGISNEIESAIIKHDGNFNGFISSTSSSPASTSSQSHVVSSQKFEEDSLDVNASKMSPKLDIDININATMTESDTINHLQNQGGKNDNLLSLSLNVVTSENELHPQRKTLKPIQSKNNNNNRNMKIKLRRRNEFMHQIGENNGRLPANLILSPVSQDPEKFFDLTTAALLLQNSLSQGVSIKTQALDRRNLRGFLAPTQSKQSHSYSLNSKTAVDKQCLFVDALKGNKVQLSKQPFLSLS